MGGKEECPDSVPLENIVVQGLYKASHFHLVNKCVFCLLWIQDVNTSVYLHGTHGLGEGTVEVQK